MRVDYHIHTFFCGHAVGTAEDYIVAAKRNKLDIIAFTDHVPLWYLPLEYSHQELRKPRERFDQYVDHVRMAKWWYSDFQVGVGMEIDYIPGCEAQMKEVVDSSDFDFVLGSVHFVGPVSIYDANDALSPGQTIAFWERYLSLAAECAESGLVDSIGHIDILKHVLPMPVQELAIFRQVLRRIADAGVCIELNTSGLRTDFDDTCPARSLLKACCEAGVDITVGSDAHTPDDVGSGLDEAYMALRAAGYGQIAVYTGRAKRLIDIPAQ